MQSVSYRIWTRVTVSISYDDNNYTTGTSSFGLPSTKLTNFTTYLLTIWLIVNRMRGFMPSPKGINLKVNVIVREQFELAHYDFFIPHVNHFAKEVNEFWTFK